MIDIPRSHAENALDIHDEFESMSERLRQVQKEWTVTPFYLRLLGKPMFRHRVFREKVIGVGGFDVPGVTHTRMTFEWEYSECPLPR